MEEYWHRCLFVFKLSYIKAIENAFNVCLPIIMDSPRTNELSEESTNQMMEILKRDFFKSSNNNSFNI